MMAAAVRTVEVPTPSSGTEQSLGGEDFAWYLAGVPGALARLGVCPPGTPEAARHDLHQGRFDADERAIPVGVRVLVSAALLSFS
jgi:amidohydrolase